MERRRRTRQTDDEVIIYDPVEEEMKEKESKEKQIENLDLKDVKLSDEDTSNDELEVKKEKSGDKKSAWISSSEKFEKQKIKKKITFHIQINVGPFSDDSTESNDVIDANDVVVLDGTWVRALRQR